MSADSVIEAIEAAVQASPDDPGLRAHLADLYAGAGRHDEAVAQVKEALALDPTSPAVLKVAVDVFGATGDGELSARYERILQALSGDEPDEDEPERIPITLVGDELDTDIPDTVDELLDSWEKSEPLEEVEVGHLAAAGVKLADVGGLARVKQQLERSFLGPMRNPEMAAAFGKSASGGLLLWGPPGCGKTFLARATAGEMGANFYSVGLSDVLDMWIGASERNLASIFDAARRNTPCVLFFDEIDALGQKRSNLRHAAAMRGVVNQLLSELDGVAAQNDGLFVLAATNHPWDVDEALLRPGRFDRRLLVLPPDVEARQAILTYHLRGKPMSELDFERVLAETEGFSGADIAFIVETATENALDASLDSGAIEPITTDRLHEALVTIKPSIGPWLETARNHVMYSNRSGDYDELEAFLAEHDRRSRHR